MLGKLGTAWSSPYVVLQQLNEVNVRIAVPGNSKSRKMVIQVNYLKPYCVSECAVLRVMVVAEESDKQEPSGVLVGDQLTPKQVAELQTVLEQFYTELTDAPSLTNACQHQVHTGHWRV